MITLPRHCNYDPISVGAIVLNPIMEYIQYIHVHMYILVSY